MMSCDLVSEMRTEVRGDSRRSESVVEDRFDYSVVALDVIVDREGEMLDAHAMMPKMDWVYSGVDSEIVKGLVDAVHEMVEYPCAASGVEILRGGGYVTELDEVAR